MKRIKDGYLDKIESVIKLTDKKVLEIGCGNGSRTIQIAERCKEVDAIEPANNLIAEAEQKNNGLNIKYHIGEAQSLPFEENRFDIALFTLSLHHVPEDKMTIAIDEAIRVTKKDGHIIFLEPSFEGSFFEAEIMFDACDGDERKQKALAYYKMLEHKSLEEIKELEDETVFAFDSAEDFISSLNPKRSSGDIALFLTKNNFQLKASRRINIFKIKSL